MQIGSTRANQILARLSIFGPMLLLLTAPAHLPIGWSILVFVVAVTAIIVAGSMRTRALRLRKKQSARQR